MAALTFRMRFLIPLMLVALMPVAFGRSSVFAENASTTPPDSVQQFVRTTCADCHSGDEPAFGLNLESIVSKPLPDHAETWEKVVRKLRSRQMPPPEAPQPHDEELAAALTALEQELDREAERNPQPGRTDTFRRLTRTEYQNAIRDLLAIDFDAAALLPRDESSHGFDNITVGELSPTLLNRYVSAAQKVARLAVGRTGRAVGGDTIRVPADITQEKHIPGLPIGTRGGALIQYTFPQSGEYEVAVRLARDRNEHVEGLNGQHQMEVLLDRERVELFTISPPPKGSQDFSRVDAHLVVRFPVTAGPHELGVTFPRQSPSLIETDRQPYQSRFNYHRHPRTAPAVFQVSITGPFDATGPGETPSRKKVFIRKPADADDEEACANEILTKLARQAWRQPVSESDIAGPMEFFREGRDEGGFDAGIESALAAILVSPKFLFRIERDPAGNPVDEPYEITDVELASRLSFFLWSSIPDDELLELAIGGELRNRGSAGASQSRSEHGHNEVLEQQVRRMLADERSRSLVTNFAGQWLYLRNLDSITPDLRLFPDFDENLRQAMRTETELLVAEVVRNDGSVLDLLRADYTYLNERLAKHYGIPHVHGSRFRRVDLGEDSRRGGLLRHGSILTVTSYATRTSPVIRGHWILQNLIGTPPPPPPANVPALEDNTVAANLSVRERLAQHRADPNCASCHNLMDPVGFALENYDAVGRWRDLEAGTPVDATGGLPDGSEFVGVEGLEAGLLARPELFVGTLTEKLMTYALGRGVDYRDAPAIRKIVRQAADNEYRFSSLVLGIVNSKPFRMRAAE